MKKTKEKTLGLPFAKEEIELMMLDRFSGESQSHRIPLEDLSERERAVCEYLQKKSTKHLMHFLRFRIREGMVARIFPDGIHFSHPDDPQGIYIETSQNPPNSSIIERNASKCENYQN